MGIGGLFTFLNQYARKEKKIKSILDKKIGIDIFWFMHKCLGDYDKLKELLNDFMIGCNKALFVFDGKVSNDRKAELQILREKRKKTEEILEKLNEIPTDDMIESEKKFLEKHIEELKIQAWAPRGHFIESVKAKLVEWWGDKAIIIVAPYEADLYFGELEKTGQIHCIISNDSDMIALGYKYLIRPEEDCDGFIKIYEFNNILRGLNMTISEWEQFIELCRGYNGKDILIPYSIWRVYLKKR